MKYSDWQTTISWCQTVKLRMLTVTVYYVYIVWDRSWVPCNVADDRLNIWVNDRGEVKLLMLPGHHTVTFCYRGAPIQSICLCCSCSVFSVCLHHTQLCRLQGTIGVLICKIDWLLVRAKLDSSSFARSLGRLLVSEVDVVLRKSINFTLRLVDIST